jgi:hypothetical protein
MVVRGNVNLAGELSVKLTTGSPPETAAIPLIRFTGARTGSFANVTVSGLDSSSSYSLVYGPGVVILRVTRAGDRG